MAVEESMKTATKKKKKRWEKEGKILTVEFESMDLV